MLQRLTNQLLLTPEDVLPTDDRMTVISAFNPGAIAFGDEVIILVRVAEAVAEKRRGYIALPRWDVGEPESIGEVIIDWMAEGDLNARDMRVVEVKATGNSRLTFSSHLRAVRSKDGMTIDPADLHAAPRFDPATPYETYGVEDPRITKIDDTYYFTYVAVSRHGACTALASTRDFKTYERHGIIFSPENKDVLLFPRKIKGQYGAIHRPNPNTHFNPPEMWFARSPDLINWGDNHVFGQVKPVRETQESLQDWRMGRVGGGCPPIEVEGGWLEIYHGNNKGPGSPPGLVGTYSAGALLLDPDDPWKVLKHSREPIMVPEVDYEVEGFVPNVVFPTGIVDRGDTWLIYYGTADTSTAVVEWSKEELLSRLVE